MAALLLKSNFLQATVLMDKSSVEGQDNSWVGVMESFK